MTPSDHFNLDTDLLLSGSTPTSRHLRSIRKALLHLLKDRPKETGSQEALRDILANQISIQGRILELDAAMKPINEDIKDLRVKVVDLESQIANLNSIHTSLATIVRDWVRSVDARFKALTPAPSSTRVLPRRKKR